MGYYCTHCDAKYPNHRVTCCDNHNICESCLNDRRPNLSEYAIFKIIEELKSNGQLTDQTKQLILEEEKHEYFYESSECPSCGTEWDEDDVIDYDR